MTSETTPAATPAATAPTTSDPTAAAELAGVRAIVTGGASGIGAAIVRAMLARGAQVTSIDRVTDGVPEGARAEIADVTDDVAIRAAVAAAAEAMGGIDVVANNAGIGAQGSVADNDDAEWLRVLDVNVLGIVRVTRAALPYLRQSPHAAVVNTGSIGAWTGLPNRALYSASKGAVQALTLAMATDHVREGIRVNCVNPGTADTPWVARLLEAADDPAAERAALEARQPSGRLVSADEVAHAVCYLASPLAAATTGALLAVDGGSHALRARSPEQP